MDELDQFHYHEAVDRIYLFRAMLEDYVMTHPAILAEPFILDLLEKSSNMLGDAYQAASNASFDKFPVEAK